MYMHIYIYLYVYTYIYIYIYIHVLCIYITTLKWSETVCSETVFCFVYHDVFMMWCLHGLYIINYNIRGVCMVCTS
jgi:hypothetical protein